MTKRGAHRPSGKANTVIESRAEHLVRFAAAPSLERWREILRFVPPEHPYQRQRNAIRQLRRLGVEGDVLFRCATEYGLIPGATELVEEGHACVATILEWAEVSAGARATYLGLAAQAAFRADDMLGAVRLLREAMAVQNEWCSPVFAIYFMRERGTEEQNRILDRAGVPHV
jgi:hypothetical protein